MRRLLLLGLPWLALACSSSSSTDGGGDAGATTDTGATNDGSMGADMGTRPDTGVDAGPCAGLSGPCTVFTPDMTTSQINNGFSTAAAGSTLIFTAGTFHLNNTLGLSQNGVTIKGAGADQTILDYQGQIGGSDGILAMGSSQLLVEDLAIRDTVGNGLKVLGSTNTTFRRLRTSWTSTNSRSHGPYGIYPVQCVNILIESSTITGAADTGVYVGQSKNIVVRYNTVRQNVSGIEIENCFSADVYGNLSEDNTAGTLVFDLPGELQHGGHQTRVFGNTFKNNNTTNFADPGDIVARVPAGTGVVVMANHDIEVFGNTISGNNTVGVAVISYLVTQIPISDPAYYPFPLRIYVHDNQITGCGQHPDMLTGLGQLLGSALTAFPLTGTSTVHHVADLLYDGLVDTSVHGTNPNNPMQICFTNNPGATFSNLRFYLLNGAMDNLGMILSPDITPFTCMLPPLPAVSLPGH
jgi:parallel beta-helix repeat protein